MESAKYTYANAFTGIIFHALDLVCRQNLNFENRSDLGILTHF